MGIHFDIVTFSSDRLTVKVCWSLRCGGAAMALYTGFDSPDFQFAKTVHAANMVQIDCRTETTVAAGPFVCNGP